MGGGARLAAPIEGWKWPPCRVRALGRSPRFCHLAGPSADGAACIPRGACRPTPGCPIKTRPPLRSSLLRKECFIDSLKEVCFIMNEAAAAEWAWLAYQKSTNAVATENS